MVPRGLTYDDAPGREADEGSTRPGIADPPLRRQPASRRPGALTPSDCPCAACRPLATLAPGTGADTEGRILELSSGTLIAARYRLAERLGGGGMGEVWRARDEKLRVEVAAKRLVLDPYATPEARRAASAYAIKESRHAAALRTHPNVVTVHDVVEDADGIPWTIMDLVRGRSLAQALAAGERFGPDQAASIGRKVLEALEAAHARGITHRDVKPGNIMVSDDGRILLVDFGIAKHPTDTRITQTGMAVGTVEYMAPERFDGEDGPPGDLWALGVTLHEMVEGVSPFRRETMMAVIRAIAVETPARSSAAGWLADPIERLLDKNPRTRPTAAQARALLPSRRASGAGHIRTGRADRTGLQRSAGWLPRLQRFLEGRSAGASSGAARYEEPRSQADPNRGIVLGIAEILNEIAGIPIEEVQPHKSFTRDLDVDSLTMVEVLVAAEERFHIRVPDAHAQKLSTVDDAVAYVVAAQNTR
ncbi:acyl carrier protein [Streptomyces sp. NPDC051784]|uniref:acyl carrier protein n=1 Tax=Streptomyces sp. NPDC051784 TaxID=3155805 RepID=UPI00341DD3F3